MRRRRIGQIVALVLVMYLKRAARRRKLIVSPMAYYACFFHVIHEAVAPLRNCARGDHRSPPGYIIAFDYRVLILYGSEI